MGRVGEFCLFCVVCLPVSLIGLHLCLVQEDGGFTCRFCVCVCEKILLGSVNLGCCRVRILVGVENCLRSLESLFNV